MNYLALRCATAVLLAGLSLTAAAQSASAPAQYGDYHAGNFGDIDQGHFGNAAAGNFTQNNFPRTQEGQVRSVDAVPTHTGQQSMFRKPAAPTDSPYVTLPKPADASR
jgi:hypothetical protein